MMIISYCKLGLQCTYKGGTNGHLKDAHWAVELFKKGIAIPVCPEVFGALTTPRDASEITGGNGFDVLDGRAKVVSCKGADVTSNFINGARMCVEIAKKWKAGFALLNECSPSCGVMNVYDGTFTKKKTAGPGVLGAMLMREIKDIKLYGELEEKDYFFLVNVFDNHKNLW